jgi:hypothetical protein
MGGPDDIVKFIPEKWRGTALFLVFLAPYISRAVYALRTTGGLKGVLSSIWLGTNTPLAGRATGGGAAMPDSKT